MGLAFDAGGSLWATGGTFREGPGYTWKIGPDGSVQHWTAVFINGCTLHENGHTLLACESVTGRIPAIDLREPGRWSGWLTDERVRIADGVLVEHWDVLQDELTQQESQSGRPMFGTEFAT